MAQIHTKPNLLPDQNLIAQQQKKLAVFEKSAKKQRVDAWGGQ